MLDNDVYQTLLHIMLKGEQDRWDYAGQLVVIWRSNHGHQEHLHNLTLTLGFVVVLADPGLTFSIICVIITLSVRMGSDDVSATTIRHLFPFHTWFTQIKQLTFNSIPGGNQWYGNV